MMATEQRAMTFEEYRAIQRMNASTIVHGFKSMLHLKRAIEGEVPEETLAMRFGQQYHELILEPEQFEQRTVVMPNFRKHPDNVTDNGSTSTNKTKWSDAREAEFRKQHAGKVVVERDYYDRMLCMLESLHTHPKIPEILQTSRREVTLQGTICHTEFKGRTDLLDVSGEWGVTDLKGTNDVSPWLFGSLAVRLHYPEKLAIYRELARQEYGKVLPVHIIAVETEGDFDRTLTTIPEAVLDHAWGRVNRLVLEYENAKKTNNWPGIDRGEDYVDFAVPNHWMPDDEMEWE